MFLASASHLALQRNSSRKNENVLPHVVPDVYDFLSLDEHNEIFLDCIMQEGIPTSETTQSEHDGQV